MYKLIYSLLVGFIFTSSPQAFDKAAFYTAMASGSVDRVVDELAVVTGASFPERDAYEGALLMRRAGLVKPPAEKLKYFKAGRIRFETAIVADPDNTEYRFLRLTIQEHAPRIVKYYKEQEADSEWVKKNYKKLPPAVQKAIIDYSRTSKVLNLDL